MSCLFDSVLALAPDAVAAVTQIDGGDKAAVVQALRRRCAMLIGADVIVVHGAKLSEWQKWDSDTGESLQAYALRMQNASQWGGGLELVAEASQRTFRLHLPLA